MCTHKKSYYCKRYSSPSERNHSSPSMLDANQPEKKGISCSYTPILVLSILDAAIWQVFMSSIFIGDRLHPICFDRTTRPFYDISKTKQCRLKNVCIFWFPRDKDGVDLGRAIIQSSFEKRITPRVKCKRPKTFTEKKFVCLIF